MVARWLKQDFKIVCVSPFGLEGLWLCYAALQNLIPSFPWIATHTLHPGAIQGKKGIKFCHLATLVPGKVGRAEVFSDGGEKDGVGGGGEVGPRGEEVCRQNQGF